MNYAVVYPRFWLWYFVPSVALAIVGSLISIGRAFGGAPASSVVGLALGWAALWPLYGYARQRRVNPRWLWLAMFVVSCLGMGLLAFVVLLAAWSRATLLPVVYSVPPLALAAPSMFALHQYVFRSPHIWNSA